VAEDHHRGVNNREHRMIHHKKTKTKTMVAVDGSSWKDGTKNSS
jgi:hypothetical protein